MKSSHLQLLASSSAPNCCNIIRLAQKTGLSDQQLSLYSQIKTVICSFLQTIAEAKWSTRQCHPHVNESDFSLSVLSFVNTHCVISRRGTKTDMEQVWLEWGGVFSSRAWWCGLSRPVKHAHHTVQRSVLHTCPAKAWIYHSVIRH